MPFADCVVTKPRSWCVQNMALLTKSRLEKERTRTVERSTVQLSVGTQPLAWPGSDRPGWFLSPAPGIINSQRS